jgi:hypothetical protein
MQPSVFTCVTKVYAKNPRPRSFFYGNGETTLDTHTSVMAVSAPNSGGIEPVNLFVCKIIEFIAVNPPISGGIEPDSLFWNRSLFSRKA